MERIIETDARKEITRLVNNCEYDAVQVMDCVVLLQQAETGKERYRAGEYVFGTVMHEPWASPEEGLSKEFWNDAKTYLETRGYELVDQPQEGDVVGYAIEELPSLSRTSAEVAHMQMEARSH